MMESYDNMKLLLNCVNYKKYQWQLCGDMKVVAVLMDCSRAIRSFAVSRVNGTVGQKLPITRGGTGLPDNH
jgi:hypothetical protein